MELVGAFGRDAHVRFLAGFLAIVAIGLPWNRTWGYKTNAERTSTNTTAPRICSMKRCLLGGDVQIGAACAAGGLFLVSRYRCFPLSGRAAP